MKKNKPKKIIVITASLIVAAPLILVTFLFLFLTRDKYDSDELNPDLCKPTQRIVSPHFEGQGQTASLMLEEALEKDQGAGIAAAVMINGELVWSDAVGFADMSNKRPLTRKTRMRLGSVSKTFTAITAAKLSAARIIDLTIPINSYVPSAPKTWAEITGLQLMAHTSGIRHYNFSDFFEANNVHQYNNLTEGLEVFKGSPLVSKPGEEFHYTSFGYNLLGAVLENAADAPFEDILSRNVVEPLGLEDTALDKPDGFVDCRSRFYTIYFNKFIWKTLWRNSSDYYPSGGILSTADDLVRFANGVFNSNFLDPETKRLIIEEVETRKKEKTGYSLGWEIKRNEDGIIEWYGHGGETNGALAFVRYYPANKMTVAAISNYNYLSYPEKVEFLNVTQKKIPELFAGL